MYELSFLSDFYIINKQVFPAWWDDTNKLTH